jgi:hypothetical protein
MSTTPTPARTGPGATPLPSTPPAQPSHEELTALTAVLQAERAAVYGYGVVGGKVGRAQRRRAAERLDWHALNRDAVTAQLSLAGSAPPAGPPAYALPFTVADERSAHLLAEHLELGVAATYADLVGVAPPPRRISAATALAACAVAGRPGGAVGGPFPGLPERSDA